MGLVHDNSCHVTSMKRCCQRCSVRFIPELLLVGNQRVWQDLCESCRTWYRTQPNNSVIVKLQSNSNEFVNIPSPTRVNPTLFYPID